MLQGQRLPGLGDKRGGVRACILCYVVGCRSRIGSRRCRVNTTIRFQCDRVVLASEKPRVESVPKQKFPDRRGSGTWVNVNSFLFEKKIEITWQGRIALGFKTGSTVIIEEVTTFVYLRVYIGSTPGGATRTLGQIKSKISLAVKNHVE